MTDTKKLEQYFDRLWPLCRSITGKDHLKSLDILSELIPLTYLNFETGQKVNDWFIPKEWNARDAYFIDPSGIKRASFKVNNLHLVNYSIPFKGKISLSELKKHIYYIQEQPQAIPYITSYYKERWGFCLSYNEFIELPEGEYEVFIDTELKPGKLVVAETLLEGESKKEILFSTYLCHPSLANNELTGPLALSFLYDRLSNKSKRHFTYRFVISVETIGTIAYLSQRGEYLKNNMIAGYQMTCLGDPGKLTLKKSRSQNTLAERAALKYFAETNTPFNIEEFDPGNGSDERQYCSPGYDLPMASLMRTMYARYPEYHTSLDNKNFISMASLAESIDAYEKIVECIESSEIYLNNLPYGEPNLGRRGLYPTLGLTNEIDNQTKSIMWLLNYCDGKHELEYISEKSKINLNFLKDTVRHLESQNILTKI
ncbi:MAG: DUF4910 domain-containing protein [Oligoflexia bacterium]|nr:DUF4910 domain-containing protein [Oligoflexia bacterium]